MVWGCFCYNAVGRLERINGTMDQEVYLDILEEPLMHSKDLLELGEDWIFQQDNDSKHTTKHVKEWLGDNVPNVLSWPSQSPDRNPIESLRASKSWSSVWHRTPVQDGRFCMDV
eukprot:gene25972-31364_t